MKSFDKFLEEKNGLWANIHAKRKRGEKPNPPGHPDRPTAQDFKDAQKTSKKENYVSDAQRKAVWASRNDEKKSKKEAVEEKKLTPAELKKREEIAKAMERENPGMDMSKKMAIATATAKRVAEAADPQMDKIRQLVRLGLMDKADMAKIVRALNLMNAGKTVPPAERGILFTMLNELIGMITGDQAMFQKARKAVQEAKEDDESASPDEAGMAMSQLDFIAYASDKIADYIEEGASFPEWFQNKLTGTYESMKDLHAYMEGENSGGGDDDDEDEEDMNESATMKPGEVKTGLGDLRMRLNTLGKKPRKEAV